MGQVTWTSEAELWMKDIHDHIARDSPTAAQRTVRAIYEKAKLLTRFPQLGYVYRDQPPPPIRILLYGHYRIAYVIKSSRDIDVIGVFHGALDIDRYLP